jgi:hypothetical protein
MCPSGERSLLMESTFTSLEDDVLDLDHFRLLLCTEGNFLDSFIESERRRR